MKYSFEKQCICDGLGLRQLFEKYQPDAVMNFAAESHVDRSIDGPGKFIQTNVMGTFTICRKLCATGARSRARSANVFASCTSQPTRCSALSVTRGSSWETTAYAPNSPYAASKASSDHLVRAWHHTYGLPTLVTNCSNNYGPYHFPEKLIPHMIIRGLAGEPCPSMATERTSVIGSMSRITPRR